MQHDVAYLSSEKHDTPRMSIDRGRHSVFSNAIPFTSRIEARLLVILDEIADEKGISRNQYLNNIISEKFESEGLTSRTISDRVSSKIGKRIAKVNVYRKSKLLSERAKGRQRLRQLRTQVVDGYGAECVCCGEKNRKLLTIDHVNGYDGRRGERLLHWIINHNFPPQYQLLCFNCNCGRQLNGGVCPHKKAN